MILFQRIAWWLALPIRLVLTAFLSVVLFSVFAGHGKELREMLTELWTRP